MNIIILSMLISVAVIAISVRYVIAKAREVDKQKCKE